MRIEENRGGDGGSNVRRMKAVELTSLYLLKFKFGVVVDKVIFSVV